MNCRPWLSYSIALSLITSPLTRGLAATPGENTSQEASSPLSPRREPLRVKVDLKGMNSSQQEVVLSLMKAMGGELSYWADFPIAMPPTQLKEGAQIIELNDLYQIPTSAEAAELAVDENGERIKLNPTQLKDLRQEGLIRVPSKQYPGMEYVWKVSAILQEGQQEIEIQLQKDEASGLEHLLITVPLMVSGRFGTSMHQTINLRSGLRNLFSAIPKAIGDLIGFVEKKPKYKTHEVEQIIEKEKAKYMVSKVSREKPITNFAQIYDEDIMKDASKILIEIDDKVGAAWQTQQTEIEDAIRAQFYKDGEAVISNALTLKRNEMVFEEIARMRSEFEAVNPGLTDAILNRAKALPIIFEGEEILNQMEAEERERVAGEISANEPVNAKIPDWLNEQVDQKMQPILRELQKQNYEMTAQELEKNNLPDEAKLVRAQAEFVYNNAVQIRKEMAAQKAAAHEVTLRIKQWRPSQWNVLAYEIDDPKTGGKKTHYVLDTYKDATTVASTPFWRLWAAWDSSRYIVKNGLYHLVMTNFLNGPLGIKHVFKDQPFSNRMWANPATGKIEPDPRHLTTTMRSRTRELWKAVAEADAQFEASQPAGILGKDSLRLIHKFKNRLMRGYGGTGVIWGCGGVCVLANTVVTTGIVGSAFVWAPMTSLFALGFDALVFDTKGTNHRYVNRFSPLIAHLILQPIKGLGMTIGGAIGAIVHGAIGSAKIAAGRSRAAVVKGKDALMRKIFFGRAMVPKANDRVTTLVEGSGISSQYFYQIKPEIAVMGLVATLEQTELETFKKTTQEEIDRPVVEFKEFFNRTLSQVVTIDLNATIRNYSDLVNSTSAFSKELEQEVAERKKLYDKILANENGVNRSLIKQTKADLAETLMISQVLVKDYFTEKVFARMSTGQIADFWRSKRMPKDEWAGLTQSLLVQTFSREFLSPLEETDSRFRFVVGNDGLERDLERLVAGKKINEESLKPVIIDPNQAQSSIIKMREIKATQVIPSVLLKNACQRAVNKLLN